MSDKDKSQSIEHPQHEALQTMEDALVNGGDGELLVMLLNERLGIAPNTEASLKLALERLGIGRGVFFGERQTLMDSLQEQFLGKAPNAEDDVDNALRQLGKEPVSYTPSKKI